MKSLLQYLQKESIYIDKNGNEIYSGDLVRNIGGYTEVFVFSIHNPTERNKNIIFSYKEFPDTKIIGSGNAIRENYIKVFQ